MRDERSAGALLLCVLAAGLLGVSAALPWFSYHHSSGRQTPPGGFHDANETGVVTHTYAAGPSSTSGDIQPEQGPRAQRVLDWIAWTVLGAVALLVLAASAELPGVARLLPRPAVLALHGLALAGVAAALALAWFWLPVAMGRGVDGPFTSFLAPDGYTQTTLRTGFVLAALAVPAILGAFLCKYQAGGLDPTSDGDLREALQ